MEHYPTCENGGTVCRICHCAKEWHPLDGRCRVGPETEFTQYDCYCEGYIPKDNLMYLEWQYEKKLEKKLEKKNETTRK
jgi:hypothetical protein